ncbi:MAG: DUF1640 domain-containing protein [Magnetococcales bacterium]|nr:DUF1640 domain-containing protein [Magnetococcales bacterium]
MSHALSFDTLAFVRKLETAGVPSVQAEAQAEAISSILQQVEESRLKDLATKGDIQLVKRDIELVKADIELAKAELRKEIEAAKVETIKWVIATGIIILGGVAAIIRLVPPAPVSYVSPHVSQEMRLPALPPQVVERPPAR